MSPFAAFIEICEEDAIHLDACLAEVKRLGMPFGAHFDRCSDATKRRVLGHPFCVAYHSQDENREYTEKDKQVIFDKLCDLRRFKWLVHWNVDEVWEKDAPKKLDDIAVRTEDHLYARWVNCWGDMQHIRTDGPFNTERVKIYNIGLGRRWRFDHLIIFGCKLLDANGNTRDDSKVSHAKTDLVCLHHGLMTHELRLLHKERWDRIYGKHAGHNPYGIWMMSLDAETYPPVVSENVYL